MECKISSGNKLKVFSLSFLLVLSILAFSVFVYAAPSGPTTVILGNSTKNPTAAAVINTTINGTISPGGYIFITRLTSLQQNSRWKGYVGNVTGTLTLDDANDNTIFQWTLSTVTGEVYATRASGSINWSGVNCTWIADDKKNASQGASSNRTPENNENQALSHTNKDDNITKTFQYQNHSSIIVLSVAIGKNECFSAQTWQRDSAQAFDDSDNENYTEVLLYDGAFNRTNGNLIYETKIENDVIGYRTDSTYDFQMIVPESGVPGFASSNAYYFYVELT